MRLWIPLSLALFALACTSGTSAPDAGGVCPATEPRVGTPCSSAGLECDYNDDSGTGCATARCGQRGGATLEWGPAPSPATCRVNGSDCPAGFSSLAEGAACPLNAAGRRCAYAEGACGCTPCLGDGGTRQAWKCLPWSVAGAGCPTPRPLTGSACATDKLICDWDQCCAGFSLGSSQQCVDGRWQSYQGGPCSCAMPACK